MDGEKKLTRDVFSKGMKRLTVLFGEINEETVDIYYDFVKNWKESDFIYSVNGIIKYYDKNYFPKPAVFKEYKPTWRVL